MSPNLSQRTCLEAGQLSLRPFPPGMGNSPPGEGWPLPPPDACSDPEPRLWEPTALGRAKPPRIVRVQPASSAKPPPGPERFPPEKVRLPPLGLSSGRHHVHPEEGRPPHASGNPQQEPGERATVEEPSGMLGITRVQSASSATPLRAQGLRSQRVGRYRCQIWPRDGSICLPEKDS